MQFLNRKQKADETIENYARVLNDLASNCKYQNCCLDRLLRDAFISGLKSSHILGGLLQDCENNDKKSFNDCVDKAKLLEQISHDAHDIRPNENVYAVKSDKYGKNKSSNVPQNYTCIRCGSKGKHLARNCYALDMTCNQCQRTGHLSKACKSNKKSSQAKQITASRRELDEVAVVDEYKRTSASTNQLRGGSGHGRHGAGSSAHNHHCCGATDSHLQSASTVQSQSHDDDFYSFLD